MSNAIFPTLAGLSWDGDWTVMFSTKIKTATSGKEYRAAMMSAPLYKVQLPYEFLRSGIQQELQTLFAFFQARQGSFDSFLFLNPNDNAVVDQAIGTGNATNKVFQLVRGIAAGFSEPTQNINVITNIKIAGVAKALTTDYIVSSSGLITFVVAPANGALVTATFSYYYRARFLSDSASFKEFVNNIFSTKSIELMACLGVKI